MGFGKSYVGVGEQPDFKGKMPSSLRVRVDGLLFRAIQDDSS